MTTTYGTIPTSSNGLEQRIARSGILATQRPWKEMITSFSTPRALSTAFSRVKGNISYFYTNYAIVVLAVIFLSLLWQPGSLIVFVLLMGAWLYLYFLRDEPLVVLGYAVDERVVLVVLSIFTTALLLSTATANVVAALAVGVVAVVVHGAFRVDSILPEIDHEQGRVGGGSGLPDKVNLMETASSNFSSYGPSVISVV